MTLHSIAVRPAGTKSSARCVSAKNAPSWSRPIAATLGRSAREGTRSLPTSAKTIADTTAASPARFSANQSGVAWARACLETGHIPPKRKVETAR